MTKKDEWQKLEKEPEVWTKNKETAERLEEFWKDFLDTDTAKNLEKIFDWNEEWKNIEKSIKLTYENLRDNKNFRDKTEKYLQKYEVTNNFSEELSVIVAVETKLWNNLDEKQKKELISLIIWREIKEISSFENIWENTKIIDKNNELENTLKDLPEELSKQIKEHSDYPILEWLLQTWEIKIDYVINKLNIWELSGQKIEWLFHWINNKIEEIKRKNSNDFIKSFPDFVKWKEESEIVKKLSENYVNFWNWNEKLWLFVSIERTLNELNKKTFRKNDLYYEYIEKIRRKPLEWEDVNQIIKNKIWKLAYIMWLIDWKNPFYNEEKDSTKWATKEKLNEIEEETNQSKKAERIKELIKENKWKQDEKWDEKISEMKEELEKIKKLEDLDAKNNIDLKNAEWIEKGT